MRRWALLLAAVAVSLVLPWAMQALGLGFYTSFATRVLIYGIAASGLNLVLGYGGMICFGQSAFFGLGAYAAAIAALFGFHSIFVAWPAAALVAAGFAALTGLISLRTQGVYFLMITLAFAQMLFYVFVSLKSIGGDEGLALATKTTLPLGVSLGNPTVLYYAALAATSAVLWLMAKLSAAPFGQAVAAIRENEKRATALGFPVFRVKLACFALGGAITAISGALIVNLYGFATPANLAWPVSARLMVMVILGGVGRLWGGLLGALVVLGIEEGLSEYTVHWAIVLALVILAAALYAPAGLIGLLSRRRTAP